MARSLVPPEVEKAVVIAQAARAAALVHGLTTGNGQLIGFGMDDRLAVPRRKQLIGGYEAGVRAGLEAGAFGVTISGAGSALLAIAPKLRAGAVAQAMAAALSAAGNPATAMTPGVSKSGLVSTTRGRRETGDTRRKKRVR
jgi:homoserine kinase